MKVADIIVKEITFTASLTVEGDLIRLSGKPGFGFEEFEM